MTIHKVFAIFFFSLGVLSLQCTGEVDPPSSGTNGPGANSGGNNPSGVDNSWLIPQESVFDGGPGKDGIPAISDPQYFTVEEASYLRDEELILGLKVGEETRAYPHAILDWHEIINDEIGDLNLAVTYCPLTGTGIGWDRLIDGEVTTFGVSGLLYNTNLIPYDRHTDSNWSQMLLKCVNGELKGTKIKTHQLVETTWKTWKSMFPDSKVVSSATGYNRSYGRYPYGNYKTNHDYLLFPVEVEDDRLPWKERVLGVIINEDAKAYRFKNMPESGVGVINDGFHNISIVVAGSRDKDFLVAFDSKLEEAGLLTFSPVNDALPIIMTDHEGGEWTIFGEAVSGPHQGKKLNPLDSFIGYWVAWGAFYPQLRYR